MASFSQTQTAADTDDDSDEGLYAQSSSGEAESEDDEHMYESTSLMRRASKDLEASGMANSGEYALEEPEGMLPRDRLKKTPHYNERLEKQMSHMEARQFYQNRQNTVDESQLSGYHGTGSTSPVVGRSPILKARTFSGYVGGDGVGLNRTASIRSKQSNPDSAYRSTLPVGLSVSSDGDSVLRDAIEYYAARCDHIELD